MVRGKPHWTRVMAARVRRARVTQRGCGRWGWGERPRVVGDGVGRKQYKGELCREDARDQTLY
jgi:hypothetical protein